MAVLTTFVDLQDHVMQIAGMSGASDRALVKIALNNAYNEWWTRHPWRQKRAEGYGTTKAPYSTGTVEATAATTLTLTGGTWPTNIVGMKVGIPGLSSPWYRVLTRTSGTVIELERSIPDHATTVPSGTAFYAYSDEVDLSAYTDIETVLTNHITLHASTGGGRTLHYVAEADAADWGFPRHTGTPVAVCESYPDLDTDDGFIRLRVGPGAPDSAYQIRFFYERAPAALTGDADKPHLPANQRRHLVWGALREIYRMDEWRDTNLAERAERKWEREIETAWMANKRSRPRVTYVRPFDHGTHGSIWRVNLTAGN